MLNVMEDVMLKPVVLFLALSLLPCASEAASLADPDSSFPAELQGTWNPVPHDCGLRSDAENDMRFEISGPLRMNYEDVETVSAVVAIPGTPMAWRLTAVSNVVGDEQGQARVYVLGDCYLFVTDGDRMDQYLRCP